MLRLKSNYIWPAMWGNAFYDDDSLNIKSADEYGIVIGTSHHEPLMRAHDEWRRYGNKKLWNYDSTETGLKEFWRAGMQRATNEKIVSVGMRGDGDAPMSRETATALLEKIVKDQREIIAAVTGKPASETPQLWALYKEVQDYYDKGMRVPDDVTLLLCDDNWGNIRKLPKITDAPRKGGYGIYYHFDYVGGPRNYKWLNTNPIPRVWEQMHLAYEYNVKDIWIVNVGDIKPMEFPISFFLDYAWNPEKIGVDNLQKYTQQWSAAQFGKEYAKEIADIIAKYTKYNGRRKPELLDANTYNIQNLEAANVAKDYNDLLARAEKINNSLAPELRDAFFQLVLHPVKACANLQNLYNAVAWNKLLAKEKLELANSYADKAKQYYLNDSLITLEYHRLNNGKWNHMMSQTHIGYTYWQQPAFNKMPVVTYVPKDSAVKEKGSIAMDMASAKNLIPAGAKGNIFYEFDKAVSIEADHFTKANNSKTIFWKVFPDLGRTGSAITTFPVTAAEQNLSASSPYLEYDFYTYSKDEFKINAYFSPTLNFHNSPTGLQYAISIDDEIPQIISINSEDKNSISGIWNKWVGENIIIKTSQHKILAEGKHTVKYWMVNSGVVLQKLVLDFGGVKPSYLGPPETIFNAVKK
jgi:Glycosyl hydrolase family 115/Gylcosyl hydrolase family 115 C-terminal domain